MDLSKISFFKPIVGETLRKQLEGKTLAGREVVEYLRSLTDEQYLQFAPPAHWENPFGNSSIGQGDIWGINVKWIYGFSLTYLAPRRRESSNTEPVVHGFCWSKNHFSHHVRSFEGDPLDMVVGKEWDEVDWILIVDP